MKSRILSCFLIFALCFSMLSACGSDTASSDHSPSSSLQTEISDSQDSTPGETEERDGFETLDSCLNTKTVSVLYSNASDLQR